jgi:Zn-finger nucleic acid-binding protein
MDVQCPACKRVMILVEFRDVDVDYCPDCRGVWLDAGELARVLGPEADLGAARPVAGARGGRRCPHCRRRLREGALAGSAVVLDECPAGHGIWLDVGELEAIVREQASAGEASPLARHCVEVFGGARAG